MDAVVEFVTDAGETSQNDNSAGISQLSMKIIYYIIAAIGIFGNSFVLFVFITTKNLRVKLTNKLIINQTAIDLLSSIFLLFTSIFDEKSGKFTSKADTALCVVWLTRAFLWSSFTSSTYGLLTVTFERYCGVVHPIWHRNRFNNTIGYSLIVFVWLIGPLTNLSYEIPTSGVVNSTCYLFIFWPNEHVQQAVGIITVLLQWAIPICIHAYCYSCMAHRLYKGLIGPMELEVVGQASTNQQQTKRKKMLHRNIIKTLFIVTMCFVICWTLNELIWLLFNLGYPANFSSTLYHISVIMVNANCCVNPFVYMMKYKEFRYAMRGMFCRNNKRDHSTGATTVAQTATHQ